MPQYDFGTINPATKSGTQLATDLNSWRNAVHSYHRGSSRPAYAASGMIWIDDTSNPIWAVKMYNGSTDTTIMTVNTSTGEIVISGLQQTNANLTALGVLTSAANKLPYFTGSGTAAVADLTAFGRSLIDDADAATARTTLGLTIGTSANNIVQLDSSARLPAVDGSLLTGIALGGNLKSIQGFNSSATYTKPSGVNALLVFVAGGGSYGSTGGTSSFGAVCSATGGTAAPNTGWQNNPVGVSQGGHGTGTGGDLNIVGGGASGRASISYDLGTNSGFAGIDGNGLAGPGGNGGLAIKLITSPLSSYSVTVGSGNGYVLVYELG